MAPQMQLCQRTAQQVLDAEFLTVRCKLLEVAASLDRLGRAAGSVTTDHRLQQLQAALRLLQEPGGPRAEALQHVFSDSFDEHWQRSFGLRD